MSQNEGGQAVLSTAERYLRTIRLSPEKSGVVGAVHANAAAQLKVKLALLQIALNVACI